MSIFFSFLLINQDVLVGCKPLLTGCPRGGGRWGDRRDPRKGQAVTSAVRKRCPSWQGEASACHLSHTAAASHFVTESTFWKPGRTSCLPGWGTASAGPVGLMSQLYSMLACTSGNPTIWHWLEMLLLGFLRGAYLCPKLNFSREINSMAKNKPRSSL